MKGGNFTNERIKKLRRELGLNQTDFGLRIGVKQTTVAGYENGARAPLDTVVASICREFNVSEVWLRTGEGEMFNQLDEDAEFIRICEQINITDPIIKRIIKTYWSLDEQEKAAIRKLIDRFAQDGKSP
nr:helix-turn-helix transcriptional regulator [uncultured Butyricicoccus sp.]